VKVTLYLIFSISITGGFAFGHSAETCFHVVYIQHVALSGLTERIWPDKIGKIQTCAHRTGFGLKQSIHPEWSKEKLKLIRSIIKKWTFWFRDWTLTLSVPEPKIMKPFLLPAQKNAEVTNLPTTKNVHSIFYVFIYFCLRKISWRTSHTS